MSKGITNHHDFHDGWVIDLWYKSLIFPLPFFMELGEMEIFHQNQNFFMRKMGRGVQQTACQDFLMPPISSPSEF